MGKPGCNSNLGIQRTSLPRSIGPGNMAKQLEPWAYEPGMSSKANTPLRRIMGISWNFTVACSQIKFQANPVQ